MAKEDVKRSTQKLRAEVAAAFGGKCENPECGFGHPAALQIDHIDGGGTKKCLAVIAQHSLRRPTRDDVDFYFFVRRTLFKDIVSTYSPWDEDRELSSMASRMNPEKDWVIECDNVPVGLFSYGDYEDCIYLDMVSILPSHQNRGIGTSLLDSLKAKLNGRSIRLDVHENNTGAIRYYEKRGFVVFGAKRAVGAYPKLLMEFRLEK